MLSSMLKRVDVAAYNVFKSAMAGGRKPGIQVLGLSEDGVGWALDEHNEALVSAEMRSRLDQVRADIIAGKIKVHDYMSDNSCTY